jgi:di/tricarboxylate transporter
LFAIVLYTRERLPIAASSLLILTIVLVWVERSTIELDGTRLEAGDILAGFGNEALIAITALMILARGLETTNALQPVGREGVVLTQGHLSSSDLP